MATIKVRRNYRLLDKVAKELFPVTDSEVKCAITRREHEQYREKEHKVPIMRHLFSVDDGLVIRLRK
ncbi:MAG TPA: hypothetical protein VFT06_10275 [Flavisolibacter sp.]|nr:hypothetical protein [Flavisolibacter sp.]